MAISATQRAINAFSFIAFQILGQIEVNCGSENVHKLNLRSEMNFL